MKRVAVVVTVLCASGCIDGDERRTDLVGLGPVSLTLYLQEDLMWGSVLYARPPGEPCAVLGDDFASTLGSAAVFVTPGGMEEVCTSPTTGQPCTQQAPECRVPTLSSVTPPDGALLTLGDASRAIECDLGDAFVPRRITGIPSGTWSVARGGTASFSWFPVTDLGRFDLRISFDDGAIPRTSIPHTREGDRVTFTIPPDLTVGMQRLELSVTGAVTKQCLGAPVERQHSYFVEHALLVR